MNTGSSIFDLRITNFLTNEFLHEGRNHIFDKLLQYFPNNTANVNDLLYSLRRCRFERAILPYPWFCQFCGSFEEVPILRIITNGNPNQQANKIASIIWPLNINKLDVVYASEFQSKPSPQSYFKLPNHKEFYEPIYIGDSMSDAEFCSALGIEFLNAKYLIGMAK